MRIAEVKTTFKWIMVWVKSNFKANSLYYEGLLSSYTKKVLKDKFLKSRAKKLPTTRKRQQCGAAYRLVSLDTARGRWITIEHRV